MPDSCQPGTTRQGRLWLWLWLWLAAGTGAWAAGETAWSYFEVLAGQQTPVPSVPDAGYLLFPLLAVAGCEQRDLVRDRTCGSQTEMVYGQ